MESLAAVLPITAIVLLISVILVPVELGPIVMFLVGALMLILGMGLFTLGGNIITDAFGVVAMVAMTPLITIQILGLVSQWKQARLRRRASLSGAVLAFDLLDDDAIIEL